MPALGEDLSPHGPVLKVGPVLPGEVVTHALVRFVDLPDRAGAAALVTLDNGRDHTRPNTFGPQGLAELDAALDVALSHDGLRAICITGKPYGLSAGADLSGVAQIQDRETALEIARLGHRVLQRLGESPVPTFAFVNGVALGGGLELALHCTYRTVSSAARGIGLPECAVGLVPAWGGSYLLPHIVGVDAAVRLIVENPLDNNRLLDAGEAFAFGLVDALLESADFLESSLAWAGAVLTGQLAVNRRPLDSEATWAAAVARGRAVADGRTKGLAPAPYRALELITAARDADRNAAFAAEDQVLADLLMGEETRASLYSAELIRRSRGATTGVAAPAVGKAGIIGAGLMAGQLALLLARRLDVPVVLTDVDLDRASAGVEGVHAEIERLAQKGRISPASTNRLHRLVTAGAGPDAFAGANLVIEAVVEDLTIKREVLASVETVVAPTCLLATNTSALSVSAMADELEHPERFFGFHVFNPVAVMPLVEVVRGRRTDEVAVEAALAIAGALRKTPLVVLDAPGFVVNRLLTRLLLEVLRAVDDGVPIEVANSALDPIGLPMRPIELLGLVGPAVAVHVAETLHAAFGDRFSPPRSFSALATGAPSVPAAPDRHLVAQGSPEGAALLRTVEDALADEVSRMLADGVVPGPSDIDLAMLLGAGWATFNGGITPYLDRVGAAERVMGQRFLPKGVASISLQSTRSA
jgi:3-hydroxyacyl-CoA dehydrogenase/enoyl-CoA hydratase/carnithine racemase